MKNEICILCVLMLALMMLLFLQTICKRRKHPYCDKFTYCGYAPPAGIEKAWLTASIQCDNQEKLVIFIATMKAKS